MDSENPVEAFPNSDYGSKEKDKDETVFRESRDFGESRDSEIPKIPLKKR